MTATLYGEGSDHGQARTTPAVERTDADHAAERAARFRRETRVEADRPGERLSVRLAPGYKARLRALAESDGHPVGVWIEMWIQTAEREAALAKARKR